MIKKLLTHSQSANWCRAFSTLLMVALLMPLIVMVPAPAVEMGQTGQQANGTPNMLSACALTIGANGWWGQPPYLPPLYTVNWD